MELLIIIAIIALAAAYVARNFYRKFMIGAQQNTSCGCSGCDCSAPNDCDVVTIDGKPPENCPEKDPAL